jgi:hypothetical protein
LTKPFRKPDQPFDKLRRLGFRGAEAEADDLMPTIAGHRDSDYRRNRDDAAAVAGSSLMVEVTTGETNKGQVVIDRIDAAAATTGREG